MLSRLAKPISKEESMNHTMPRILTVSLVASALLLSSMAGAKPTQSPEGRAATAKAAATKEAPQPSKLGVVNINTATEEQLCLLPRVGPAKARAIVKYRTKQKFKGTYDLVRVKGIGHKSYRDLRPFLTIQGETTLTQKPRLTREKEG
jgi:competence protein ComEA